MNKCLEVKSLSKAFNKKEVLKDISFSLYTNEVVALVGGNGAGKSTMLDILGRVSKDYKGTVDYLGLNEDKIGVMFQSSSFPAGIKVKHLVTFALKTHKIAKTAKSKIEKLTVKFAIDSLMNKSANKLSGGERQRVGLFLAMIHNPKVLYLDEPTAGLDIESKNLLINILKDEIKKRKMTVVIVTHEMAVVESIIDRVIILQKGVITFDEPIKKFRGKFKTIDKAIESKVFGGGK